MTSKLTPKNKILQANNLLNDNLKKHPAFSQINLSRPVYNYKDQTIENTQYYDEDIKSISTDSSFNSIDSSGNHQDSSGNHIKKDNITYKKSTYKQIEKEINDDYFLEH